ncbi:hypothetical protein SUGI_0031050 [Cryptomeria japonica]|uniref:cytochrome P450 716B1 n=1 Tax=Cryptomeria japonica TaxID=3369 RepID=UPI002408B633|nr:cytochrome P450 716B1 [Cryptomeria japonica]GLJ06057.1 hypothetical protein SUGI_0031050 [Cryptomeria japonica]
MDISTESMAISMGVLLLAAFLLLLNKSSASTKTHLPRGTMGWPVLGETLQYAALRRANRGRDFYEERRKRYGPQICKTHLLGSPVAILHGSAGIRFLHSNENKLVQSTWPSSIITLFGNSLFGKAGDDAKDLRATLLTFLKPEALQKFVGTVDSIVNEQLSRDWVGKQQIKAFPHIKRCLFSVACALFVSLEEGALQDELYAHFLDLLTGMMKIPLDLPGTLYRKAIVGSNQIRRILQTLIEKRRKDLASGSASSEQDLLSFLLCNKDERGNTMAEGDVKDNIMMLLIAGHDTSVITVTMLLKFLALNRDCYREVLREQVGIAHAKGEKQLEWSDLQKMKYTWRAAQETLRIHPPSEDTWRKALVDISYGGFIIPKGWKLLWSTNSTHKSAEYFDDPEKFDPSRFEGNGPSPYTFLPFGGGPRMCPGNEFARMVILVLIHNIVTKFEWDLVDVNEKVSVDPMPAPVDGLPIQIRCLSVASLSAT